MTAPATFATASTSDSSPLLLLQDIPFRPPGVQPDAQDGRRAELVGQLWHGQDGALRLRDREIEENVRMLVGQQWTIFNPITGRWIDITQYMSDDERRWRQRPVFNRLLPWFMLTHARFTENPPILTFIPGPDRVDADLAETMDTIFKIVWREADAPDAWDRAVTWLLVAGSSFIQSRVDVLGGPMENWIGPAEVPVVGPDGQPVPGPDGQPATMPFEEVPLGPDGQPVAVAVLAGDGGEPQLQPTGEPHRTRTPRIVLDVMSPLEVRGEWGATPWHQKTWHMSRHFLPVDQVEAQWGRRVKPTPTSGISGYGTDGGELNRLLFGTGYHGASSTNIGGDASLSNTHEALVDVYCLWQRPTLQMPEGRYLVVTATGECLFDGPRPIQYPNTSPIRRFDFVRVPGRQSGLTPLSSMRGPQRALNKRWAQLFEHAALVSNPKPLIDATQMDPNQWSNQPGKPVALKVRRPGVPPVEWLNPPSLGSDVWRLMGELREELSDLGMLRGTEGEIPSSEASGELIKELRFNSDRAFGPPLRRAPDEWGRVAADWIVMLPVIYPFERLLSYAGDDNRARTLMLRPELFREGKVDVVADAESMLPEGRGERQLKVMNLWKEGALGMPNTAPGPLRTLYDLMRFPHISRVAKPGGVDRTMAEQENGQLVQGAMAQQIPTYEWYDHLIHLDIHESLMKGPEFIKLPPEVQEQFAQHREAHRMALAAVPPMMPPEGGGMAAPGAGTNREYPPLFPGAPNGPASVDPGNMPGSM